MRSFLLLPISLCVVVFVLNTSKGTNLAQAQEAPEPNVLIFRTLVQGLKSRESSATTASGYFSREIYNNASPDVVNAFSDADMRAALQQRATLLHIYWAADGIKVREDQKSISSDGSGFYDLKSFNGERVQSWGWGDPTATELGSDRIAVGGAGVWLQLNLGKNAKPLSQNLEGRQCRFVGQEDVAGVETFKIEASPLTGDQDIETWWIAPEYGSIVMKHERKSKSPLLTGSIRSYRVVDLVDETRRVNDNLWVPASARRIAYITLQKQPDKEVWQTMFHFSILSLQVNEPVSPQVFELPLPLGTRVSGKGRETYIVGGDTSSLEEQTKRGLPDPKALLDVPIPTNAPGEKTP